MAKLDILQIGHPTLRKKAQPVPKVTKRFQRLARDMLDTMAGEGIGLAAPQVGESLRIITVDIGEGPFVLFNPEIVEAQGQELDVEGCLSIPDTRGYVRRAAAIVVTGLDSKGRPLRVQAEGLLARVFQHEIDHLDGKLFVDSMVEAVSDSQPALTEDGAGSKEGS